MDKEVLNLQKAELQYCVKCPTCKETLKLKTDLLPFVQA